MYTNSFRFGTFGSKIKIKIFTAASSLYLQIKFFSFDIPLKLNKLFTLLINISGEAVGVCYFKLRIVLEITLPKTDQNVSGVEHNN